MTTRQTILMSIVMLAATIMVIMYVHQQTAMQMRRYCGTSGECWNAYPDQWKAGRTDTLR